MPTSADVTSLTTAFAIDDLFGVFVLLAPWILGVVGFVVAISLIKWGIRVIRRKMSGGAA